MTKAELSKFVQAKIDEKANIILDERMMYDDAAFGELEIYSCLRRILNRTAKLEDIGKLHAVSDLMQALGVIPLNQTLAAKLER